MYVPHILKEFREIGAVGQPGDATYREAKSSFGFDHPEAKLIKLTEGQHDIIVQGMIGSVNGGTSKKGAIGGFQIAGKTGTAQVVALGKDTGKNKDHAWFVSFAPASKPEIAVIGLIENSGFGGDNAAPAVRGVYQAYLAKRGVVLDEKQVAMK
jgi:penicillin-binding protein 2